MSQKQVKAKRKIGAPTTLDPDKNIRSSIAAALKVYARITPREQLGPFLKMTADARSLAQATKGFSPNKHFLYFGRVPTKIANLMCKYFGVEWNNDPRISRIFWSEAKAFRINETTVPMTNPEFCTPPTYPHEILEPKDGTE